MAVENLEQKLEKLVAGKKSNWISNCENRRTKRQIARNIIAKRKAIKIYKQNNK